MIELYKLITDKYDHTCMPGLRSYYIDVAETTHDLRSHRFRLKQQCCTYITRQPFFTDRSVLIWNSMPENVVAADTVNIFKLQLDKFFVTIRTSYMITEHCQKVLEVEVMLYYKSCK